MIRSYNSNYKPSHWDEYAQLCEALVYTTLETLQRRLKFKLCTSGDEFNFTHSAEYADAYHFLMSEMFVAVCAACEMDAYSLRDKIKNDINHDQVTHGDAEILKEKKKQIILNLRHGSVIIEVPYKWRTGRGT